MSDNTLIITLGDGAQFGGLLCPASNGTCVDLITTSGHTIEGVLWLGFYSEADDEMVQFTEFNHETGESSGPTQTLYVSEIEFIRVL